MKIFVLAFVVSVLSVSDLEAQHALPFTKKPVSRAEYVEAIKTNDAKVLNVDCGKIVTAVKAAFETVHSNCEALASYVEQLVVTPCPQAETALSRVLANGAIDLRGWRRNLRKDESCLFDNNAGLWFASLSCGNLITSELPVGSAMKNADVKAPVTAKPDSPAPVPPVAPKAQGELIIRAEALVGKLELTHRFPDALNVNLSGGTLPGAPATQQRRSWIGKNWGWVALTSAVIAGGVVCALECRVNVSQTVNVPR